MKITERRLRSIIRNVIKESKDHLDPNAIGEWMEVSDDDEDAKDIAEILECSPDMVCYLEVGNYEDQKSFAKQESIDLDKEKIVQIGRNKFKYVVFTPHHASEPFIFTSNYTNFYT